MALWARSAPYIVAALSPAEFQHALRDAERHLLRVDPRFSPVVQRAGPCALKRAGSFRPFDALLGAITSQQLTAVRGIGRWTVEMMLMFRLGRLDVMPIDDLGVRKGFGQLSGAEPPPTKKALLEASTPWAPCRTVASWYLWRVADV